MQSLKLPVWPEQKLENWAMLLVHRAIENSMESLKNTGQVNAFGTET